MLDDAAFLATILASPGDDGPRLVFADWLEEARPRDDSGDRAEFIRVQCRIAQLERENLGWPVCAKCGKKTHWYEYTPRCRGTVCKLRMREYYSSRRHIVWGWLPQLVHGYGYRFRRGFLDSVSMHCAPFLTHAAALFAAAPVTAVRLTDREPDDNPSRGMGRGWYCPAGRPADGSRAEIPGPVWRLIPRKPDLTYPGWKSFPTAAAAHAALRAAAVAFGRAAARGRREPVTHG